MMLTGTTGQAVGVLALIWNPRVLTAGLYLGGTLLAGAVVIALVKRWRKRADSEGLSPSAQLAQFRSLYEEGAISKEEFERLRSLLGGQMRQDLNVPARRPAPAPQGQAAGTPEGPTPQGPGPEAPRPAGPPETGIRPG
jgi:hypothetical protein